MHPPITARPTQPSTMYSRTAVALAAAAVGERSRGCYCRMNNKLGLYSRRTVLVRTCTRQGNNDRKYKYIRIVSTHIWPKLHVQPSLCYSAVRFVHTTHVCAMLRSRRTHQQLGPLHSSPVLCPCEPDRPPGVKQAVT